MTKIGLPVENVEIVLGDNNIKTDDRIFTDYFRDKEKEISDPFFSDEGEFDDDMEDIAMEECEFDTNYEPDNVLCEEDDDDDIFS